MSTYSIVSDGSVLTYNKTSDTNMTLCTNKINLSHFLKGRRKGKINGPSHKKFFTVRDMGADHHISIKAMEVGWHYHDILMVPSLEPFLLDWSAFIEPHLKAVEGWAVKNYKKNNHTNLAINSIGGDYSFRFILTYKDGRAIYSTITVFKKEVMILEYSKRLTCNEFKTFESLIVIPDENDVILMILSEMYSDRFVALDIKEFFRYRVPFLGIGSPIANDKLENMVCQKLHKSVEETFLPVRLNDCTF